MRVLIFGDFGPGALASSLEPGVATSATVIVTDPYGRLADDADGRGGIVTKARSLAARVRMERVSATLIESVDQLRPEAVLIVKGRGVGADAIKEVQNLGVTVAIYYPDNPSWGYSDTKHVCKRLAAANLAVVWSERIAAELRAAGACTRVLPFGFDDRWWTLTPPGGDRHGIVFFGTWSPRREDYLASLEGLPLLVSGTGWARARIPASPPMRERAAGELLATAAIGINLLHPQCAGAHNMRTREIAAAGALQLTDPGTDGTPLRPPSSCCWFKSPAELRLLAEHYLAHPEEAAAIAASAQLLTRGDTYIERGRTLAHWLAEMG